MWRGNSGALVEIFPEAVVRARYSFNGHGKNEKLFKIIFMEMKFLS